MPVDGGGSGVIEKKLEKKKKLQLQQFIKSQLKSTSSKAPCNTMIQGFTGSSTETLPYNLIFKAKMGEISW